MLSMLQIKYWQRNNLHVVYTLKTCIQVESKINEQFVSSSFIKLISGDFSKGFFWYMPDFLHTIIDKTSWGENKISYMQELFDTWQSKWTIPNTSLCIGSRICKEGGKKSMAICFWDLQSLHTVFSKLVSSLRKSHT